MKCHLIGVFKMQNTCDRQQDVLADGHIWLLYVRLHLLI